MPKTVISDTGTLILFKKIEQFELLKAVYGTLVTTPEISHEYGSPFPEWFKVQKVSDRKYQKLLETQVDKGEASAIALASEIEGEILLLLDDLKARKLAKKLELRFTGTLGIINKAKEMEVIDKVKPLVEALLKTDFRIAQHIIEEFLRANNEN